MEVRYEINDCGHFGPMEDDVFWRYIRLLADSLYLKMPVAVSTDYSKERILEKGAILLKSFSLVSIRMIISA